MKKMTLKVDDLRVDSFATSTERMRSGTVAAHGSAGTGCDTDDACCWAGTHGGGTCDTTCHQLACGCTNVGGTCDVSCGGTCFQYETCEAEGCDYTYHCPTGETRPGCC